MTANFIIVGGGLSGGLAALALAEAGRGAAPARRCRPSPAWCRSAPGSSRSPSPSTRLWSHVFILIGHGTMMVSWWLWYAGGYTGVAETLRALAGVRAEM